MTRQDKINKVSHFCAKKDCADCEACEACERVGYGSRIWRWSAAPEDALDAVITAMGDTDGIPAAPTESDPVNHPPHYTHGGIECIDALESATAELTGIEAVCTANAIKYLWRWKHKNGVEDLQKAMWYIQRLIARGKPHE